MLRVKLNESRWEDEQQYIGGIYDAFEIKGYDGTIEYALKTDKDKLVYAYQDACEVIETDVPCLKIKVLKAESAMEEQHVGNVYEAFKMEYPDRTDYAAQLTDSSIWGFNPSGVELVEEESLNTDAQTSEPTKKILLVEDGSVDVDDLETWCNQNGIKMIVYRQGANKPELLDI